MEPDQKTPCSIGMEQTLFHRYGTDTLLHRFGAHVVGCMWGHFETYLSKFQSLANQIPEVDVSDKQRLTTFNGGCRPKTQADYFQEM